MIVFEAGGKVGADVVAGTGHGESALGSGPSTKSGSTLTMGTGMVGQGASTRRCMRSMEGPLSVRELRSGSSNRRVEGFRSRDAIFDSGIEKRPLSATASMRILADCGSSGIIHESMAAFHAFPGTRLMYAERTVSLSSLTAIQPGFLKEIDKVTIPTPLHDMEVIERQTDDITSVAEQTMDSGNAYRSEMVTYDNRLGFQKDTYIY